MGRKLLGVSLCRFSVATVAGAWYLDATVALRLPSTRNIAVSALVIAAVLPPSGHASSLVLQFSSKAPKSSTAMTLHIRYTKTGGDPNTKPSPIRRFQLDAPAGTAFHTTQVPACEASDAEVMLSGPGACPSASRIGGGTVTVITGFGQPFDPFVSPTPVFNDGKGWLEVSQTPSDPAITVAVTRLTVTGSRVSGPIGASPGGPPDGQSAVSAVDLSFAASTGYITTPPTCPASGKWVATGTFTFADGTTQVVTGDTPCTSPRPGPRPSPNPRPAIHASVRPRRVRAGRRARVRVTLRSGDARCIAAATVHIPGHRRVHTDDGGRVTIVKTFHERGRRTLTATKRGCKSGRATLTVLPRGENDATDR
jgi:hypothetical protein